MQHVTLQYHVVCSVTSKDLCNTGRLCRLGIGKGNRPVIGHTYFNIDMYLVE